MKSRIGLIFSFIILLLSACTKIKTTDIGSGLIPPVDGVLTKDTIIDVTTKNAGFDSTRVGISEDHVVGYLNDPLFGKTYAKINFQASPSFFPYSFEVRKDSLHLDSVVLVLGYDGAWGDTNQNLSLHAYEIASNQEFRNDTVYLNTNDFATSAELTENNAAKIVDIKRLKDSGYYFQDSGINQIRLRLNPSFGQRLLNTYDSTNAYLSDSAFKLAFKGFQIAADPGVGNALLKINLLSADTKLALYYKYDRRDSVGKQTAAVKYFTVKSITTANASAHSNYIKRDYSGTQVENYYPSPHTNDSLLFLQTGPGIYASVNIDSGISSFPNVIVHRAELIVDQVPDQLYSSDNTFSPPYLFLAGYREDSARRFALYPDVQFASGSSNYGDFGSIPFLQTDNGSNYNTYRFNITRYIQNIFSHQTQNFPLVLFAAYNQYVYLAENSGLVSSISYPDPLNAAACGRVRVAGGSIASPHKMRLHIIYSLAQ